jgi:hypothetical protein
MAWRRPGKIEAVDVVLRGRPAALPRGHRVQFADLAMEADEQSSSVCRSKSAVRLKTPSCARG